MTDPFFIWCREQGIIAARLTHGELYHARQRYNNQAEKFDLHVPPLTDLPPRMDRKTAAKYYNEKLKRYWLSQMDRRIPEGLREKALEYLKAS